MPLKLFLKSSLKTAEGTGDLIGNPPKNSTIPSKTEIPWKRYTSPKKDFIYDFLWTMINLLIQ